jgi:hypothetical protein
MEEDRKPAIDDVLVAAPDEASLRLQVTDLLLGRPGGVPIGRHSTRPTVEQGAVLRRIEAALEAYRNFFYPPEQR